MGIGHSLTLALAAALTLGAFMPAHSAPCPREIEVVVDAAAETGLDTARFMELCGASFTGDGVTLTTGLANPDYVLTVGYEEYEQDGETHGRIGAALGFTGGTMGQAHPTGGVDEPMMGYGQTLDHDGAFGRGVSIDTIASHLAAFGARVPAIIRENERISESASIDLPSGCYRPNEAREITVTAPLGPYVGGLINTDVIHRFIVRAQYGDIRNGTEWKEDPRARVFLLDAARDRQGGEFTLDYISPIGRESDHVTVWSSCDVSHLPVRHPSIAVKHETIAESDIAICGGYRLEYAHEFTIEHDEAALLYTLTGEVLLKLTGAVYDEYDRVVGGKLEGEATLPVIMAGNFRDCTVTYTNQMTVKVTGDIRRESIDQTAGTVVQVELEENYGTVGAGVIDCPGQEPFVTGGVPTPTVTQGQEAQLIFEHEEGNTMKRAFEADGVTGDAVWIIHVPER